MFSYWSTLNIMQRSSITSDTDLERDVCDLSGGLEGLFESSVFGMVLWLYYHQ
jgi:hypothetical protein